MAHKAGASYTQSFRFYANTGTLSSSNTFTVSTCNTTNNSSNVTCDPVDGTTDKIRPGAMVSGTGIPADTIVLAVVGDSDNDYDSSGLDISSFTIGNAAGSTVNATVTDTDVTLTFENDRMYFLEHANNDTPWEWTEYVNHTFPPTGYSYTGSYTGPGPSSSSYTLLYNYEGINRLSTFVATVPCRLSSISFSFNTLGFPITGQSVDTTMRIGLLKPIFAHNEYAKYSTWETQPIWETIAETTINFGTNPAADVNTRKTVHFAASDVGTLSTGDCCGLALSVPNTNVPLNRGAFTLEFIPT